VIMRYEVMIFLWAPVAGFCALSVLSSGQILNWCVFEDWVGNIFIGVY